MNTYDFTLGESTNVRINLENLYNLDPYLRLLDASGSVVASNDDGGEGLNAWIQQTLDRGSYRIEATQYNAETGGYLLTVDIANPPAVVGVQSEGQTTFSGGLGHTCGLRESGAVVCWGNNRQGQAEEPAGRFSAVSASGYHSCGLRETGAVVCWGDNEHGQTSVPGGRFSAVSTGAGHSCGLRETGAVECWGDNRYGQTNAPSGRFSALSTGLGFYHACGVRESGAVECWGASTFDQADIPLGRFSALSALWFNTCGLRDTGTIVCWGDNEYGQTEAPSGRFSAVSAGRDHSCGLRETGAVECWGHNWAGQADAPAGRFSAVSAGADYTCGLRETGAVECWGLNLSGQADPPSGRFRVPGTQPDLPLGFDRAAPQPTWERGRQAAPFQLPAAQGGSGEVTYRIVSRCGGTFTLGPPGGLEFDAINRVLRGTLSPSVPEGLCTLQLTATDSTGQIASLDVTADIRMPADFRWLSAHPAAQEWTAGESIDLLRLPSATSSAGGLTYSLRWAEVNWAGSRTTVHDRLPPGLRFDELAKAISGVPNESLPGHPDFTGSYELIYTATDASGVSLETTVPFSITSPSGSGPLIRARIAARRLADDRTELGLRVRVGDDQDQLLLPETRHAPESLPSGRWWNVAPIQYDGASLGHISVRKDARGRTELSIVTTSGERISPARRFFPARPTIERWQQTSWVLLSVDSVADGGCAGAIVDLGVLDGTTIHSGEWGENDCTARSHIDGYVITVDNRTEVTIQVSPASYVDRWSGPASSVSLLDSDGLAIPHDNVDAAEYGGRNGLIRATLEPGRHRLAVRSGSSSVTGRPRPWEGRYTLVVTTDGDNEGDQSTIASRLTPAVVRQIAETYAPVWKLDSDEVFRPTGIEAMLDNSHLKRSRRGMSDGGAIYRYDIEVLLRDVTVSDLLDNNPDGTYDIYLDLFAGGRGTNEKQWSEISDEYGSVVYSRVVAPRNDTIVVQYWTFWVYNNAPDPPVGPSYDHEGDWEGIQLVFSGLTDEPVRSVLYGRKPTWLGYATHGHGDTYDGYDDGDGPAVEEVEYHAGAQEVARPVVYVAQGSHASYADALSPRVLFENNDRADGKGKALTLRRESRSSESEYELRVMDGGESWLAWQGQWGAEISGPKGPLAQGGWWTDPLCWEGWENAIQNRGTYTAELRGCGR